MRQGQPRLYSHPPNHVKGKFTWGPIAPARIFLAVFDDRHIGETMMKKSNLRATSALQALALLGAGVTTAFVAAAPAAAQDYTRGNLVGTV